MKKLFVLVCFLLIPSVCFAASKSKKQVPKTAQETVTQEPDEIQKEYIARLCDNSKQLKENLEKINTVERRLVYQDKKDDLARNYFGNITREHKESRIKHENDIKEFKNIELKLNESRKDLKMDVLKYYKGKLPQWVKEEWTKEEDRSATELYAILVAGIEERKQIMNK